MKVSSRSVLLWLSICTILVAVMVLLGGATRLTESGLSITVWKPISGILPPLSEAAWAKEFLNYQSFPEYKLKHMDLDLSGFKFIFWMEYSHRLLGRILGLVFLIPLVMFWGKLGVHLKKRLFAIAVLILLQGVMGWYMVKSGLVDNPYVSHYRLAAHLSMAFVLLGFMLWTIFDFLPHGESSLYRLRGLLHALLAMIMVTIIYGAFVAGLRAGSLYNTFPLMGGQWIPHEWLHQSPWIINFVENQVTVQLVHRWLGIATFITALLTSLRLMSYGMTQSALILALGATLQACLGIATLIYIVPVKLALMHQFGAILLFSMVLSLFYRSRRKPSY